MKYMIDTNTIIFAIKGYKNVTDKFSANLETGLSMSSITLMELEYGIACSSFKNLNQLNLAKISLSLSMLNFDSNSAIECAKIRAALRFRGTPIGPMDALIAAHAKSENLILVTNNTREFSRVEGLQLEDWTIV
jgi:tRNA(fMet)-specific endonuclease VapC